MDRVGCHRRRDRRRRPPDRVFADHGAELALLGAWVPGIGHGLVPRTAPTPASDALAGTDLVIGYDPDHPVRTFPSVTVPAGLSTTLTGANGSGKTTLALTLAGLIPALGGQVVASDSISPKGRTDPFRWRSRELLTRIGTVFQDPEHQFVSHTVAHELGIGLHALKRPASEVTATVDALLEQLHLTRLAKANPFTLSGGEKRRLSVGTVLATSPAVVLLDEPTFGQDRNIGSTSSTSSAPARRGHHGLGHPRQGLPGPARREPIHPRSYGDHPSRARHSTA